MSEGLAKDYLGQRFRRVRAVTDAQVQDTVTRLQNVWSSESHAAGIESSRGSYRGSSSVDPHDDRSSNLSNWKAEALRQTVSFPALPKAPESRVYQSGSVFAPLRFTESGTHVHLDEYALFQSYIRDASKFRLDNRLAELAHYPIPEPSRSSFPKGTVALASKRCEVTWKDYLRVWSILFRLQVRNEVSAFNKWLNELREDRQTYWLAQQEVFEKAWHECMSHWEKAKSQWIADVQGDAAKLSELRHRYETGHAKDVTDYFMTHLNSMPLPGWCPRGYEFNFDEAAGVLLIECQLPYFGSFEIVKTRERASGPRFASATQREARELTNRFLCLIPLRLMWEVPQVDYRQRAELVCCNAYADYDDPATGQHRRDVILSVAARREDLHNIRLDRVEPEACFRGLKGVAAAKLWELVPVKPIIHFDKADKRFIAGKDVLSNLKDTNLATMDWQEFEHLIRELFEQEFASGGGEVKVTQASRDRGVDAVVFDPDPLRGGKLIIQAKRYTNTVDVSAVRDLYGTVINEGANKGILVTTSNYGRDAYEFAKDKPIILLNGENLLHLLNKHGYKLRIDLKEARDLLTGGKA